MEKRIKKSIPCKKITMSISKTKSSSLLIDIFKDLTVSEIINNYNEEQYDEIPVTTILNYITHHNTLKDTNLEDENGNTVLMQIIKSFEQLSLGFIKNFTQIHPEYNFQKTNNEGETLLMLCIKHRQYKVLGYIIDKYAKYCNIDAVDKHGNTCFTHILKYYSHIYESCNLINKILANSTKLLEPLPCNKTLIECIVKAKNAYYAKQLIIHTKGEAILHIRGDKSLFHYALKVKNTALCDICLDYPQKCKLAETLDNTNVLVFACKQKLFRVVLKILHYILNSNNDVCGINENPEIGKELMSIILKTISHDAYKITSLLINHQRIHNTNYFLSSHIAHLVYGFNFASARDMRTDAFVNVLNFALEKDEIINYIPKKGNTAIMFLFNYVLSSSSCCDSEDDEEEEYYEVSNKINMSVLELALNKSNNNTIMYIKDSKTLKFNNTIKRNTLLDIVCGHNRQDYALMIIDKLKSDINLRYCNSALPYIVKNNMDKALLELMKYVPSVCESVTSLIAEKAPIASAILKANNFNFTEMQKQLNALDDFNSKYEEKTKKHMRNNSCLVCFEETSNHYCLTGCGHTISLCKDCSNPNFKVCPVCRADIKKNSMVKAFIVGMN